MGQPARRDIAIFIKSITESGAANNFVNFGTILLGKPHYAHEEPSTIIVSGVGRSGTSAVAKLLHELGVPMGNTKDRAVYEDEEFVQSLLFFDHLRLKKLIEDRNTQHSKWGVKFASLQNHLMPPQMTRFRNPHLVVVMRDTVATASRAFSSDREAGSIKDTLLNIMQQTSDLMNFVMRVECPVLLISYEKLIAFPDQAISALSAFCGVEVTDEIRQRAKHAIEPNNRAYIQLFHNQWRGYLDGVLNNCLIGWCCAGDGATPVDVELLANGKAVASAKADLFRQDLLDAGIGDGSFSFKIDIAGLKLNKKSVLQVRVAGQDYMLDGSGRTLQELRGK